MRLPTWFTLAALHVHLLVRCGTRGPHSYTMYTVTTAMSPPPPPPPVHGDGKRVTGGGRGQDGIADRSHDPRPVSCRGG